MSFVCTHHTSPCPSDIGARTRRDPGIDLCVIMLLVGLRYRTLAPGLMEELCLLELVHQFLRYPNMCALYLAQMQLIPARLAQRSLKYGYSAKGPRQNGPEESQ